MPFSEEHERAALGCSLLDTAAFSTLRTDIGLCAVRVCAGVGDAVAVAGGGDGHGQGCGNVVRNGAQKCEKVKNCLYAYREGLTMETGNWERVEGGRAEGREEGRGESGRKEGRSICLIKERREL